LLDARRGGREAAALHRHPSLARGLTQLPTGEHGAILGEADEALVEGGVPSV